MRWAGSSMRRAANRGSTIRSSSSRPTTAQVERRQNRDPARKVPYSGDDLRPRLRRTGQRRQDRVADRPDADALLAAGYGLRLVVLRTRHPRRRLPRTGVRGDLPGLGLPRRRPLHGALARRPCGTNSCCGRRTTIPTRWNAPRRSTARTSIVPFRSIRPPRNGTNDKQVPESVR